MKLIKTDFEELFILKNFNSNDSRGRFVKTFNQNLFIESFKSIEIKEIYFSTNKKNTIRGMHFQLPPFDHEKLVTVIKGSILDVVIDLRKNSKTYLKHFSYELSEENPETLFIPKGFAHGFISLISGTTVLYNVTSVYNSKCEVSIKYNSFDFDWGVNNPIVSERDLNGIRLEEFIQKSPF